MQEREKPALNIANPMREKEQENLHKHFDISPITMNNLDKLITDIERNAVSLEHLGDYINHIRSLAKAIVVKSPDKIHLVNAKLAHINQAFQIDTQKVGDETHIAANEEDYNKKS